MQCAAAAAVRPAASLPRTLPQRRQRQRQQHVAAAVQPDRKEAVPDAASAPQPRPMKIDVFETMGAEPAAPGGEDSWVQGMLSSFDFSEPTSFDGEEKTEYDPLRDGPLRYLGYANELGEAFAAWLFAGGVPLSYAIAIGYVLFDTVDKWRKTTEDARCKLGARPIPAGVDLDRLVTTIGLERGLDTLVWQLIASVAAPGYTIHTVVALANWVLAGAEESAQAVGALEQAAAAVGMSDPAFIETFNKSVPTALGLLAIPFIVHPIDGAVHAVLNATLRPALRRYTCEEAGGAQAGLAVCGKCKK